MGNEKTSQNSSTNEKGKITKFLERNEIWFKTILSFSVTIAAFIVSVASFINSHTQTQLSAIDKERENREKTAFFTIDNTYDEESKQFLYILKNTGGVTRSCSVSLYPFLHIYQHDRTEWSNDITPVNPGKSQLFHPKNHAFIFLPDFYTLVNPGHYEKAVYAFGDKLIDKTIPRTFPEAGLIGIEYDPEAELSDDYFRYLVDTNDTDSINTGIHSELVYYVQISYSNYENKQLYERFWLTRSTDLFSKSVGMNGNYILSIDNFIEDDYYTAQKKGFYYAIDSRNMSTNEVVEEVKHIVAGLFEKFGQVPKK